jgi:4-aminobutyrate aminotransferase
MPGVVHVPFANPYRNAWHIDGYADPKELTNRTLEHIERLFDTIAPPQDVAGCFWEPVQGEGGYVVPPMDFPRQLAKLLKGHGILLQADEVQTGFGRTGKMFATEHYGITVDTVSLAKAMGSGFPIGACVFRKGLDFKQSGMHSNTFGGNVLGCTAALATLDAFDEDKLLENAVKMGKHLEKRLDELTQKDPSIGDHRGLGLMRALEFVDNTKKQDGVAAPDAKRRDAVEEACWKRGLILLSCGKSSLRVIPALNVNAAQIDGAMHVLEQALKAA